MYKGVIYDLDGTLLDTLETLSASANYALRTHGYPQHPKDRYRYFVGNGVKKLVERMLPKQAATEEEIQKVKATFDAHYGQHCKDSLTAYPGIMELLSAIEHMGLKQAVLSNKSHPFTVDLIDSLFPAGTFDLCYGMRDGVPPKPDPTAALSIAEQWGVPPEEILYFGDTGTDMQTAKAAGMYAVGVLWGFRTEQELKENKADRIIAAPADILPFLEGKK